MADRVADLGALVDPLHTAVIVVDMQNYFCTPGELPTGEQMLPRLRQFLAEARRNGVRLVFTQMLHDETNDSEVWLRRALKRPYVREMCRVGKPDADYHPDFRPQPGDIAIVKHRYSAFVGTSLELRLRAMGIRTVVMTGIATNVCVESTARDAYQRDFYVVMVEDCTGTNSEALHSAALENVYWYFGEVATADEIIRAWQGASAPVSSNR